jgi:hypothetical protein
MPLDEVQSRLVYLTTRSDPTRQRTVAHLVNCFAHLFADATYH